MTSRGRFITLEGGEGSGKSTLISGLERALRQRGQAFIRTREPGGTPLAEQVRNLVLTPPDDHEWGGTAEALLMNAARADHVEKLIAPALDRGDWVLCDRFSDSTLVYQGLSGVSRDLLLTIQSHVTHRARPDLTFILDAPAEALEARRKARGISDIFEDRPTTFHEQVRQGFLDIASTDKQRCVVIDARKPVEDILAEALKELEVRLVSA